MSDPGAAFARAAEQLVGARFHLHGRSRSHGLDCVGVVTSALAAIDRPVRSLPRYALRNTGFEAFERAIVAAEFAPTSEPAREGELLACAPSPGQFHLAITLAGERIVHAHAGLRRVVASPLAAAGPILRRYRLI